MLLWLSTVSTDYSGKVLFDSVKRVSAVNGTVILGNKGNVARLPTLQTAICFCLLCLCREENSLVEQFVFEALVVFVESLGLAHSDERSLGKDCH